MIFALLGYILFVVVFIGYSVAGVYHLWRFGYVGDLTKPAIAIYVFISVVILLITAILILTRSWPSDFSV